MRLVLRPFVAYLRVYEPLSAFDAPLSEWLRRVAEVGHLGRSSASEREREMWLRSQMNVSPQALPGELANGHPAPRTAHDVMVLDPAEVPSDGTATVGPGQLFCPLDVLPRSAAAMVDFLSTAHPALREVALGGSADELRTRAAQLLSTQAGGGAVHVVSTTWTVPLPWFVIVDPARRRLVLATRDDPARQVSWRATMSDALTRVARARTLSASTFGEGQGPAKVLADTAEWLENFHPNSAVELDYGGLVQLLDDEELTDDTSAEDVHTILDALESGDAEEVAQRFERLREFWGDLAVRERFN